MLYCKAYRLADLRRFPGWSETAPADSAAPADGGALPDDTIVYVRADLTVVTSPVGPDSGVLWDTVSEDWERFCRHDLKFEIPEDLSHD